MSTTAAPSTPSTHGLTVGGTPTDSASPSKTSNPQHAQNESGHLPDSPDSPDSPIIVFALAISCVFYLVLAIVVIAYITPFHCKISDDKTLNDVNKTNIQYIDGLGIMLPSFLLFLFCLYELISYYYTDKRKTLLSNKAHRFLCTFYHLVILQLSLTIYTYFKNSSCDDVNGVEGSSHSIVNTSLDLLMTVSAGLFMVHFIYLYWSCKECKEV